ncbi:hypothetical protein Y032_0095g2826 [Ancylostoma ceylanicum]|uniref:Orcokinin n=2 Tax=Ancylostoma ceylanicum TaxID=53326 RepID=A0A016TKH5_9BILA|nr:hypothetical protein Y032_0095g2826 [Ancylostoma ceylanicum]
MHCALLLCSAFAIAIAGPIVQDTDIQQVSATINYAYAFDVSAPISTTAVSCLKKNNYTAGYVSSSYCSSWRLRLFVSTRARSRVGMIFLYMCLAVVSASALQYDPRTTLHSLLTKRLTLPSYFISHYDKRTLDFDDPRLFSAAFGKRSGAPVRSLSKFQVVKRFPYFGSDDYEDIYEKRDNADIMDPRFFTNSFGKRSDFFLDDPRFSSMSFGKRR